MLSREYSGSAHSWVNALHVHHSSEGAQRYSESQQLYVQEFTDMKNHPGKLRTATYKFTDHRPNFMAQHTITYHVISFMGGTLYAMCTILRFVRMVWPQQVCALVK